MMVAVSRLRFVRALQLALLGFVAACLISGSPAAADGRKVALVIGNSKYQNGASLPNPVNDAALVAKAARDAGFEVTELDDQTLSGMRQSLLNFRARADSADVALIYYAGHGIEDTGENWLVPIDATLADPRDLRIQAMALTEVLDSVAGAHTRMILLDACRNNPFKDRWTSLTRSFQPGLAGIDPPDRTLVVFAADKGSTISDGQEGGNSYFAQAVAKRLPEAGLSLQLMGFRIGDDVKQMSGDRQRPLTRVNLGGDAVFLVPPKVVTVAPPPLPNQPTVNVPVQDPDEAAWGIAQQAKTKDAYLGYLRQFPRGKYSGVAQDLIIALSGSGQQPVSGPPAPPVPAPQPPVVTAAVNLGRSNPPPPPGPAPVVLPPPVSSPPPPQPAPQLVPQVTAGPIGPAPMPLPQPPAPVPAPAPQPAPTVYQTSTYFAPAQQRQYGPGGFPLLPDAPVFSVGPYPTCLHEWESIVDPMARAQSTITCKRAFSDYKINWLNRFRVAMNDHGNQLNDIYLNEVAPPHFPGRDAEVQKFYAEMSRRMADIKDGGALMAGYEATLARYEADFKAIGDSYDRATGCRGYPTPAGLAPNPYC